MTVRCVPTKAWNLPPTARGPARHSSGRPRRFSQVDFRDLLETRRVGLRKMIEELLEAEVSDGLRRGDYERGSSDGHSPRHRRS